MKKNNIIKYLLVSLFVFFGCLFSSNFCDSVNFNVNEPTNIGNITVECDQNLNCTSTIGDITFDGFKQAEGSNTATYIYWSEYGLTYTQMWTEYLSRTPKQGVINNFKQVSYTDGVNTTRSVLDYVPGNSITYETRIENSSLYAGKLSSITFNNNGSAGGLFCYNYNEELGSICMAYSDNNYGRSSINLLTKSYTFEEFSELGITTNSPFVGGGGGDIPDIIGTGSTVLTNSAVALGLSYRYGYGLEDCYGGYPLNDIFTADLDPANFTGYLYGSGASIYDIFNAYSGSYFTDINTFYNSFYSRYSIGNISSFWDYPKGLYSISQRAGFLGSIYDLYPVNMANLVEFCDLKLKSDLDALYTGDNYIGIEGYYSLIGEVYDKRRYYDTNLFSGSDSTGSMSIDDFFTSVSNRLVAGLEDISDNRTGIIPTYILMVMMALILFRLISH